MIFVDHKGILIKMAIPRVKAVEGLKMSKKCWQVLKMYVAGILILFVLGFRAVVCPVKSDKLPDKTWIKAAAEYFIEYEISSKRAHFCNFPRAPIIRHNFSWGFYGKNRYMLCFA